MHHSEWKRKNRWGMHRKTNRSLDFTRSDLSVSSIFVLAIDSSLGFRSSWNAHE